MIGIDSVSLDEHLKIQRINRYAKIEWKKMSSQFKSILFISFANGSVVNILNDGVKNHEY